MWRLCFKHIKNLQQGKATTKAKLVDDRKLDKVKRVRIAKEVVKAFNAHLSMREIAPCVWYLDSRSLQYMTKHSMSMHSLMPAEVNGSFLLMDGVFSLWFGG